MDCNETRRLLEAHADGELDLVRHLELEQHLASCAACRQLAENIRARRAALRANLPRFTAPAGLADKIRAGVRAESAAPSSPAPAPARESPRAPIAFPFWQVTGLAASIALAALFGYTWGTSRTRGDLLLSEAIADHVRSLQVDHLTDVASTDQHTVKPWFAGKLDFSPPVVDLAASGFPLTGGRLDHVDHHIAAALVFHRRQHAINLFIWPKSGGAIATRTSAREGFNAVAWTSGDLNYLAVSEIPGSELEQFAAAFRTASR